MWRELLSNLKQIVCASSFYYFFFSLSKCRAEHQVQTPNIKKILLPIYQKLLCFCLWYELALVIRSWYIHIISTAVIASYWIIRHETMSSYSFTNKFHIHNSTVVRPTPEELRRQFDARIHFYFIKNWLQLFQMHGPY